MILSMIIWRPQAYYQPARLHKLYGKSAMAQLGVFNDTHNILYENAITLTKKHYDRTSFTRLQPKRSSGSPTKTPNESNRDVSNKIHGCLRNDQWEPDIIYIVMAVICAQECRGNAMHHIWYTVSLRTKNALLTKFWVWYKLCTGGASNLVTPPCINFIFRQMSAYSKKKICHRWQTSVEM